MRFGGQEWERRAFEARLGRLEQVGGLRRFHLAEGREKGVEQIQVRTGAGLCYYVSPSRALDISLAEFGGVPLSWQAPNGDVHPAYYDAREAEWLRTAVGGLLMTCGLTYVGAPGEDQGQAFGLHGRIHHLPARQVSAVGAWQGDNYEMTISGMVEEAVIFGEHLHLTRTIRSTLGVNRIDIEDQVENVGFSETPLMILYHFNFGFPLLSEQTRLRFPSQKVVVRDEGTPLEGYDRWQAPAPGYQERVYYHQEFEADEVSAVVHNPAFPLPGGDRPLTVRLSWFTSQLPRLVQWKMPGAGTHVLGIEPANCYVEGRAVERARGTLEMLAPGQKKEMHLTLEVETDG
ncbi:MAG: aldose 1-epimerase family protein [Candidatus Promineifilaceae bacterium]|nr:aldose 1-epimerase family protein [Candidatus Promineifilaceae bacterium]